VLNYDDQEKLVVIRKQRLLALAEDPYHVPKDRTVEFVQFGERLGLTEAGVRVAEESDCN
jgi:hypothetical protein